MSEKILFVDDEVNILDGLRRTLRGKFDVDTAVSGAEALAMIRSNGPYAVVVADMRMPGMNGIELLSTLHSQGSQSVRIMLTGNADRATAVDAVEKGHVFHFLSKPCSEEAMTRALQASLDLYRLHLKVGQIEEFLRNVH